MSVGRDAADNDSRMDALGHFGVLRALLSFIISTAGCCRLVVLRYFGFYSYITLSRDAYKRLQLYCKVEGHRREITEKKSGTGKDTGRYFGEKRENANERNVGRIICP